jgi:hypothetical protein
LAPAGQTLAPTDVEPESTDAEPEPADIAAEPEPPTALCPEGEVNCGGVCTDPAFDPLNCGGCGVNCGADPCVGGVCTPAQPQVLDCAAQGLTDCGGLCVDTATDPANCGACGVVCGPDSLCEFGVCVAPAPPEAPADVATAPEDEDVAAAAPEGGESTCLDAGSACDPASPGGCCSGVCNEDGTCA